MRAILKFNLNERDEAAAHLRCVRNWELAWALFSVMEEIKKHNENSEDQMINGSDLMQSCYEIIQNQNISLDEMVF